MALGVVESIDKLLWDEYYLAVKMDQYCHIGLAMGSSIGGCLYQRANLKESTCSHYGMGYHVILKHLRERENAISI